MPLVDPVTMSSPVAGKAGAAAAAAQPAKGRDAEPPTQPVATLSSSPQARVFRYAHPVLLGALFAARFGALVADPVAEMYRSLPAVWALQAAYAIACLPAAGSQTSKPPRKPRPGEKRRAGASEPAGPNIPVTILVATVLSVISAAGLHVALVLFGAPLLTHAPHTFLCALHLALLALLPLFYTRGVARAAWLEILAARAPIDEAFGGAAGACVGAWAGAVPIPLDWDRDWQRWPVTILCGAYAGYAAGKLAGGSVAFGKRFGG